MVGEQTLDNFIAATLTSMSLTTCQTGQTTHAGDPQQARVVTDEHSCVSENGTRRSGKRKISIPYAFPLLGEVLSVPKDGETTTNNS